MYPPSHCPVLSRILLSQVAQPTLDVWLPSMHDPVPHFLTSPRWYLITLVSLQQDSCQACLVTNPPLLLTYLLVTFHSLTTATLTPSSSLSGNPHLSMLHLELRPVLYWGLFPPIYSNNPGIYYCTYCQAWFCVCVIAVYKVLAEYFSNAGRYKFRLI